MRIHNVYLIFTTLIKLTSLIQTFRIHYYYYYIHYYYEKSLYTFDLLIDLFESFYLLSATKFEIKKISMRPLDTAIKPYTAI